jgi:CheY-like chemotaxis protein
MMRAVLESEGYKVATAKNGKDGMMRISEQMPDLVMCDVQMPLMDGKEFYTQLQSNTQYEHIPVIMMSAAREEFPAQMRQPEFLRKPFTLDTMLEMVNKVLA